MDTTMNLSVPHVNQQHAITDALDDPIFICNEEHPLMLLSNSPSLNNEDEDMPYDPKQLSLSRSLSMDVPIRTSELLDDIQLGELDQLRQELHKAKQELNEMNEAHSEQVDAFQTEIKKVKTQGEFLGVLKEQKQRSSMKELSMNYETELHQINRKLMITQNLHVSEIKKIKKSEVSHKLEIKLKNKKIKDLMAENQALLSGKNEIKKNAEMNAEKLQNEFNEQMEREVNKRIAQISQLKKAKNKIIEELHEKNETNGNNTNNNITNNSDKDELIISLKDKIKELERASEREQDMFFKHSEIMDFKLERETKERKRMEKKLLQQKIESETDIKQLSEAVQRLKQQLSDQKEINIHLQNNLELLADENKRLKDMESDYQLFAAHIDADYDEMNGMLEELQNKNKQKEKELEKVKEFIKVKENENTKLRVSVNCNNKTIKDLESMLGGLKSSENKFENKKKEIVELNEKIISKEKEKQEKLKIVISNDNSGSGENSNGKLKVIQEKDERENNTSKHKYATSYLSHAVDNEIQLKHIGELESIKIEYNTLINNMQAKHEQLKDKYITNKNELSNTKQSLQEIEKSKVELATNFAVEMNRIRGFIRKQNKCIKRLSNVSTRV